MVLFCFIFLWPADESVELDQETLLLHSHPNTEIRVPLGTLFVCYSVLQPKVIDRIVEAWIFLSKLCASSRPLSKCTGCPETQPSLAKSWLRSCIYLKWHWAICLMFSAIKYQSFSHELSHTSLNMTQRCSHLVLCSLCWCCDFCRGGDALCQGWAYCNKYEPSLLGKWLCHGEFHFSQRVVLPPLGICSEGKPWMLVISILNKCRSSAKHFYFKLTRKS